MGAGDENPGDRIRQKTEHKQKSEEVRSEVFILCGAKGRR
jgi:hypothetical protein